MKSIIQKLGWYLFAFLGLSVGLYPSVYFITQNRHFGLLSSKSEALLASLLWNVGFYGHITLGGIALLVGWIQFSQKIRNRYLSFHRKVGLLYVISVMISGVCAIGIGFFATGGFISSLGFILLGFVWLGTTLGAFIAVKNHKVNLHNDLMVYSYAACFAAVTLRIWLPFLIIIFGEFIPAYRLVAWLCWVPNLFIAYLLTRRKKVRYLASA